MSGMDVDQIFVSGGKNQSTDEKINLSLDELVQQNKSNNKRKSNQKIRTTIREQGARRQQKFDSQRGLKANKPAGKTIIRNRANQILKNAIKRKQRGTTNGDVTPRRNRQNNNNNDGNNNNNNNKKNVNTKKIFTKMGNRLNLQAKNRPSRPRTRAGEGWFEDRQGSNKNNGGGVKINKPTDIKITVNNDRSNNKSNTVASRRSRGNDNNRNGNGRNGNNNNNNNNRNSRNGTTRQGLRITGGVQKRQGFVSDRLRNNKKNIRVRDDNNDNRNNNNNNSNNNNNANKGSSTSRRRVVREPGTTSNSNSNSNSSTSSSTAPKTLSDRFAELRRRKNNNSNNNNNNAGNSKRRIIRRQ